MEEVPIEGGEVVPKKFTGVSKKPIILLCVVGLVLAPIAVYDDNWLNANIDTDDFGGTIMKQNVYISLDTFQMEYCADDDCEIEEKQKLGELYQLCYDEVIEEEGDYEVDNDEMEEMCGPWNELNKAGKTTKTLIFTSMLIEIANKFARRDDLIVIIQPFRFTLNRSGGENHLISTKFNNVRTCCPMI